ncbi:MAG TPA: tetratricopeptide repeat protein, partial [Iamia sp.]|nr:tetratricopeptide repeat protein [Iamia sp.]
MTRSPATTSRRRGDVLRFRRRLVGAALLACVLVAPTACSGGDDAPGADAAALPFIEVAADSPSPTDRAIATAQDALRADPEDTNAQLDLALAFVQKARETADPVLYTGADTLLAMVAEVSPDDVRVLTAQGSLALSRHEFADALDLGQRALVAAPGNQTAYGVLVDALDELGRYDEALEATQAMADVRPGLAALSRVSYARELRGDLDGAIEAMTQAATAGSGTGGENLAFTQALLGNLLLTRGDVRQAGRQYDLALTTFPELPAAEAGRARLLVAQEHYDE